MNTTTYQIFGLEPFPTFRHGDCLPDVIAANLGAHRLHDSDVVVIASKVVSIEEKRYVDLTTITPSPQASAISEQTGKDARVVELILRESTSHRLATPRGPIIATHRLGYELTSAGVDRDGHGGAYLLPEDPDASARRIQQALHENTGATIAVIIADSDGRADRRGATVIAVGAAGISPLRTTTTQDNGTTKTQEETLVDLIAAAAGVVIGQRGRGVPVAVVRGLHYEPSNDGVGSILHR